MADSTITNYYVEPALNGELWLWVKDDAGTDAPLSVFGPGITLEQASHHAGILTAAARMKPRLDAQAQRIEQLQRVVAGLREQLLTWSAVDVDDLIAKLTRPPVSAAAAETGAPQRVTPTGGLMQNSSVPGPAPPPSTVKLPRRAPQQAEAGQVCGTCKGRPRRIHALGGTLPCPDCKGKQPKGGA